MGGFENVWGFGYLKELGVLKGFRSYEKFKGFRSYANLKGFLEVLRDLGVMQPFW